MSGTKENAGAAKAAPVAEAASTASAIVAPGRSVMIGRERHLPGAEVTLPIEEIEMLRELGFFIDPSKPELIASSGPEYRSRSNVVRAA